MDYVTSGSHSDSAGICEHCASEISLYLYVHCPKHIQLVTCIGVWITKLFLGLTVILFSTKLEWLKQC